MAQKRNPELVDNLSADFQRLLGRLLLVEQYAASTDAPATTGGGAWDVRQLNTLILNNTLNADLTALPEIELPRGIYEIQAMAVGYQCDALQLRLYDVTNGAALAPLGLVTRAPAGVAAQVAASLMARIALPTDTVIRLEQASQTANAAGQGANASMGDEVYAWLNIIKTG